MKPAASPEAVQLQATSGCSQLERRGKLTSNGPRCGSNQRLVSGLRAEQKFRTCAGVPRRAPQLPSRLLGRGQRLVNRCQHPKKRTALLASSGYPRWHSSILAGIPASSLAFPGTAPRASRNDLPVGNETCCCWGGSLSLPGARLALFALGFWPPNLTALESIRRWGKEKGKR